VGEHLQVRPEDARTDVSLRSSWQMQDTTTHLLSTHVKPLVTSNDISESLEMTVIEPEGSCTAAGRSTSSLLHRSSPF